MTGCLEWLIKADTRNWNGRIKIFSARLWTDITNARKRPGKNLRDRIEAAVLEDYNYIAGIPTFFMDPTSMPEARARHMPGQAEILKATGAD